jgi:ATP-dependent helicase HrpA
MLADQPMLRQRCKRVRKRLAQGRPARGIKPLARDIHASCLRRRQRAARLPTPTFDDELPINAYRDEIGRLVARHQVVIVCGETGSGKSTQLPKICLGAGRGVSGFIGHTQPRRIAARSLASRIAKELDSPLGGHVGYKIRFKDRVSDDTYIKLLTDGMLLSEMNRDRCLRQYDTLIVDEAHERSLNIDLLLGTLKRLLPQRPELKLVITSATINTAKLQEFFAGAPLIEVSGRVYPVTLTHAKTEDDAEADFDLSAQVVLAVDQITGGTRGDVLAFLPGEREIRETSALLAKRTGTELEVLPLYGRLSNEAQDRVFAPSPRQKVILATNVAETSITVPNIGYVIDTGLARMSRYSYRTKLQRLPIEKISKASATQRAGRSGRTGPGECIRLYTEEDYQDRPDFCEPEIQRTNLAAVILRMKHLGLGELEAFPFLDAPDTRYVEDGMRLLRELGAVDEGGSLTPTGRRLARLPVDPRVGRMIIAADVERSLGEVLVIASALSVQDPFLSTSTAKPLDVSERHSPFLDSRSDFLAYLNFWRQFNEREKHLSRGKLKQWCKEHLVSWLRVLEWRNVHQQLSDLSAGMGLKQNHKPATYAQIHRALLAGSLGYMGMVGDERVYTGPRNTRFKISPSSALHAQRCKWVMASEIIETHRVVAYRVARVRPEWAEKFAPPYLLKKHYFGPYWDAKKARVFGYERVSVYGLPIVAKRRCAFDRVDPSEARAIFIAEGLVAGKYQSKGCFLEHNQSLIAELRGLEDKLRSTGILADDHAIARFYQDRIPPDILSGAAFEEWRAKVERDDPGRLYLTRAQVVRDDAPDVTEADYPDDIEVMGHRFPLKYLFDPGHEFDGVTVTVPVAILNQLPQEAFEWLVPGRLGDKVLALIRTLPKSVRRHFVPIPETAERCVEQLRPRHGSLTGQLAEILEPAGVAIAPDAWQRERLSADLRMNFEVVDADLETIAHGRDLGRLRERYGARAKRGFALWRSTDIDRDNVTTWDFGELPKEVGFQRGRMRLCGYPALIDCHSSVKIRLLDTPQAAQRKTRDGIRRLFALRLARELKRLCRNVTSIQKLGLLYASVSDNHAYPHGAETQIVGGKDELAQEIVGAAFQHCMLGSLDEIRTRETFEQRVAMGQACLDPTTGEICRLLEEILTLHHRVAMQHRSISERSGWEDSVKDIGSQLTHLVYRGFVRSVAYDRLMHYPRYLEALRRRLEKIDTAPGKERRRMRNIARLWQAYLARRETSDPAALVELESVRWLVEELRVATFAQELGTPSAVSVQSVELTLKLIGNENPHAS